MTRYYTPPPEVRDLCLANPDLSLADAEALFFALNNPKVTQ
jgi:hypothetical protein